MYHPKQVDSDVLDAYHDNISKGMFLDLPKALNCVVRELVLRKLQSFGIRASQLNL